MVDVYEKAGKAAEAGANIAVRGGGTAIGAMAGAVIGGVLERGIVGEVTADSTDMKKFSAWLVNNISKVPLSYLAYNQSQSMTGAAAGFVEGTSYGLAAEVVLDTVARALVSGAPRSHTVASPVMEALGLEQHPDYNAVAERINSLLAENSSLRERMMDVPGPGEREKNYEFTEPGEVERNYEFTEYPPGGTEKDYEFTEPVEREKNYEFTEPPVPGVVKERRPSEREFQFTAGNKVITGRITDAKVLAGSYGFIV